MGMLLRAVVVLGWLSVANAAHAFEGWMTVKNSSPVNVTYIIKYTDDRGNNFIAEIKLPPGDSFKHVVELVAKDAKLPIAEIRFLTPSTTKEPIQFGWRADNGVLVDCTTTAPDAKGERLLRVALRKGDK